MKDLRLLQILPSLESGGVEQGVVDIAKGVVENGDTSFVMSNGGLMTRRLEKEGSKHITKPVHSKNPIIIFNNIRKIRNFVSQNKINITHVRSRAPAWSVVLGKNNNSKLISTFHNVYGHKNYLKKIYNSGLAKTDRIIAISSYVKDSIVKLYNINSSKIEVIHRGIDENYFDSSSIRQENCIELMKKLNIPLDKKIILYPGRLTEWKGQIEFLNVLKKLKTSDFFCLFVGDDKNHTYKNKLINIINEKKLGSFCRILGHINNMPLIYKLSNIVISAPLRGEGFGRTISEAMAMKKIVICYNFGGVREQIKDLDQCFRVNPHNQNELLEKINLNISKSNQEIYNLGNFSRKIILDNFTKDKMIKNTIELYKNELI